MGRSLKLGSIAGIRLQVHWTFLFVILWVLFVSFSAGSNLAGAATSVGFVLVLFGCVVLHELGHALAARHFGIPTRDITLLPIGGVARLERMPRQPMQELVVALAGPAVNVLIAAVLAAVLWPTQGVNAFAFGAQAGFLQQLLIVNVALVVFNMLPAFPMDGGRVLRALLATFLTYGQATRIAARVGQVCALGLGLLGLVNPFLFVIAAFVFLGAAAEARQVTVRERLEGFRVGDAMIRTFRAVSAKTPIRLLAARMLDSPQRDYPVIDGSTYAGMLRRDEVLAALSRRGDSLAEDVMMSNVPPIEETDPLVSVLDATGTHRLETLPVTNGGMLTGLLDVQQMHELVQARANLERMSSAWDVTSDRRVDPNLN